jgi:hypothetical protein
MGPGSWQLIPLVDETPQRYIGHERLVGLNYLFENAAFSQRLLWHGRNRRSGDLHSAGWSDPPGKGYA